MAKRGAACPPQLLLLLLASPLPPPLPAPPPGATASPRQVSQAPAGPATTAAAATLAHRPWATTPGMPSISRAMLP